MQEERIEAGNEDWENLTVNDKIERMRSIIKYQERVS